VQKRSVQSSNKSEDRRIRRTRDRLSWSLIELIQEKGFDDVTVQDVAARAEVGRSTFYSHFRDKDDVFLQHFIGFMQMVGAGLQWSEALRAYRLPLRGVCEHMQAMRSLYDALVRARQVDHMFKIGRIVLAESIEKRIGDDGRYLHGVSAALLAQHLANSFMNLLMWWMDHHCPCTPQELDDQFHRLVIPGSAAAFGG
jgi:AcrR family transcriptional regulator